MIVLSLDLSTSTGFAVANVNLTAKTVELLESGRLETEKGVLAYGRYPFCYPLAAESMASKIEEVIQRLIETGLRPEAVVIEEINLGKNRYSQKILEFIHCKVLGVLRKLELENVFYLDSSEWRKNLGLVLTKEAKKANAKLAKAKREAAAVGAKLDKAALGVKGKVTKKHVAIQYVKDRFDLALKVKDDDVADAICLACAYANNATPCDGA
jgi:Holliday junction resolvasome RuvABC endonuclease subunit